MKYIFNRKSFLSSIDEALKDEITDKQRERVAEVWGEAYLDYETIQTVDVIEKGKWELSEEDSERAIENLFNVSIKEIKDLLNSIPQEFEDALKLSLDTEAANSYSKRTKGAFDEDWSLRTLSVKQISLLYQSIFKTINVGETKADKVILREENGRPKMDDNNRPIKVDKEPGELVLGTNLVTINTFISDWNKAYSDLKVNPDIFNNQNFQNVKSIFVGHENISDFKFLENKKIYVNISSNPEIILDMSVSPFYKSCQELYSGGGHGLQYMTALLSNVFDPNSVPAFLMMDTPYLKDGEKISNTVSLSRLVIRNIEDFDGKSKGLFFDKTYPERMQSVTEDMIEKYSNNENDLTTSETYTFRPALDSCDIGNTKPGAKASISNPYMDKLSINRRTSLNVNTQAIIFAGGGTDIELNVGDRVKEIIIEDPNLPTNFFDLKLQIDSLKFRYMKIKTLNNFKKIIVDNVGFDKCYIGNSVWSAMLRSLKDIKRISIKSIDTNKRISPIEFGRMENLEELELIYSFKELNPNLLESNSLRKLTVSGDMLQNDKNKYILEQLKKKGVEIKTTGLVL